jgi:hypothetical protein
MSFISEHELNFCPKFSDEVSSFNNRALSDNYSAEMYGYIVLERKHFLLGTLV